VSYREGVTKTAKGSGVFEQMIAGKPHYAEVTVAVSANPDELVSSGEVAIAEGLYPAPIMNAVRNTVNSSFFSGPLGGYPVIHTRAIVESIRTRENEFSETAAVAATEMALRDAEQKGAAILYEPVMSLEVTAPEEFLGGILHDLNGRRAEIAEVGQIGAMRFVKARVALAEMFGYATTVRGLSGGRADYSLEPCAYAAVPKNRMKDILGYDPGL
jgi:elongation factor G